MIMNENTKEELEQAAEKLWEAIMQVHSDVEYDPDYGYSLYSDPIKNALLLVYDAAKNDAIDYLGERYESRIKSLEDKVLELKSSFVYRD